MRSTSPVAIASRSAISCVVAETSTYSRSQETGTFISELTKKPEVVLPERTDLGQAVAEHGDALEPDPEREAAPFLRVVADELEHVRVDHPGAAELDPPRPPAHRTALAGAEEARDVGLERRLGEREVVGAEAH